MTWTSSTQQSTTLREADFFGHLVAPRLRQWGTYDRLENGLAGGIPDTNYVVDGYHGWLETKVVHSGKVYFERFQLPWLLKRARDMRGGLWVIATDDRAQHLWLWGPDTLAKAPRVKDRKWLVLEVNDLVSALPETKSFNWNWVRTKLGNDGFT